MMLECLMQILQASKEKDSLFLLDAKGLMDWLSFLNKVSMQVMINFVFFYHWATFLFKFFFLLAGGGCSSLPSLLFSLLLEQLKLSTFYCTYDFLVFIFHWTPVKLKSRITKSSYTVGCVTFDNNVLMKWWDFQGVSADEVFSVWTKSVASSGRLRLKVVSFRGRSAIANVSADNFQNLN